MMEVKIGQEIVAQKDYEIKGVFDEEPMLIKTGDKAIVKSNGFIEHTTGAAFGKIQKLEETAFSIKGYDVENIAKMITRRLKYSCELEVMMDDYGYEEKYILEEIVEELYRVLV